MGLERIAFLKQGVDNMYETDQVRPVLDKAVELSGKTYGANHEDDVRFRVVADHVRSSLMLMSDGDPPERGRGYILRRLMRRVIRDAPARRRRADVRRTLRWPRDASEAGRLPRGRDQTTRDRSTRSRRRRLSARSQRLGKPRCLDRGGRRRRATGIGGAEAFLLHDTYGFPIDPTLEIAKDSRAHGGPARSTLLMSGSSARAKADARSRKRQLADTSVYRDLRAKGETVFDGYTDLETRSPTVLGILAEGHPVASAGAGQIVEVILAETALYADSRSGGR
jgi:alanyl-tRNA synthetase